MSKAKRGRPRLLDAEAESFLRNLYPEATTKMSWHNKFYQGRATRVLLAACDGNEDVLSVAFAWIHGRSRIRQVIVSHLGRIPDDEMLLMVAEDICEKQTRTADALELIKKVRRAICEDQEETV